MEGLALRLLLMKYLQLVPTMFTLMILMEAQVSIPSYQSFFYFLKKNCHPANSFKKVIESTNGRFMIVVPFGRA